MLRRSRLVVTCILAGVVACTSSAPSTPDTAADEAAIDAVREREIAAFSSGQIDSLVAVLTTDAVMMPPNEPAIRGSEGVRTWAQNFLSQFTANGRYLEDAATIAGDWAVERYAGELTLTPKAGGPAVTERIKGIHVYQRQSDGTWRMAQDVWNTDAPPPPAPTSTAK